MSTLIKWWLIIIATEKIIGTIIGLVLFAIIVLVAVAQYRENRRAPKETK